MEGSLWKTLLVVGALAIGSSSSLSHKNLTYDEALNLAVTTYNNKSGEGSVYRLLEAAPSPEWDPSSESNQELDFYMKKTVCRVGDGRRSEECSFQEDGEVLECKSYFFFREAPSIVVITCETVKEKEEDEDDDEDDDDDDDDDEKEEENKEDEKDHPRRVKRFKKFLKKVKKSAKKRLRKFFKKPRGIGVSTRF
ncbi:cathelicidin-related peptide Oh-Cath-like [Erythrolamprus reginae]|uniref:cathelicidin-related peptide Oh-Cath-like n=1 Tax=Erythrolamprus reginae TaxID=121349 RepID=UPI00396C7BAB